MRVNKDGNIALNTPSELEMLIKVANYLGGKRELIARIYRVSRDHGARFYRYKFKNVLEGTGIPPEGYKELVRIYEEEILGKESISPTQPSKASSHQ